MIGQLRTIRDHRKVRGHSSYKASRLGGPRTPLSLEDLMLLTVELWVVGLLLYHLGLTALGL